nr:receptor-like protein 12 [Ipomoea batatas]
MKTPFLQCLFFISLLSVGGFSNITVVEAQAQCMSDQKILLLQLRNSLEFNSTASTKLSRWNHTTDCCDWPGVECDTSGHVITLILDNEAVTGGIDDSSCLFSLQYLETLDLSSNCLNGSIPEYFFEFSKLSRLRLSSNSFAGMIQPSLFSLPSLQILDLSYNSFDGLVDEYVNVSAVSQLESLDLSSNRLTSTVVVPKFLANFSNLKILSLGACNLQGSFPREIFLIRGLQELSLEYNDLSGGFPSFPENGSLRMISVTQTQFSGSLPASISNLSNLSVLDLSSCNFIGSIPSTMAQLTSLTYVDFSHNKFTGSIPNFPLSKNLIRIDFSFNGLTTPLSSKHFEGLSKIVSINLGSNYISGRIPPSLFSLPSLQTLDLSINSFDGLGDEYVNVSTTQLETLDLSSNRLSGSFPKYFFEFPMLSDLNLSSNSLGRKIQSSLFSLPSLLFLDLSINSFDGLGDEYMNVSTTQLVTLDLSSNRLNESFPEYFFELPKLSFLDLSSNSFGGKIQSSLFSLPSLETLDLSNNSFDGLVDEYMNVSTSELENIDLSYNRLNGSFPEYFFEFPMLSNLTLSSNSFGEMIDFESLQKFQKLTNLIVLDLSNNEIRGEIPSWIWELGNGTLVLLNLSCNFLETLEKPYTIPSSLIVLDLHSNQLRGPLPIPPASFFLSLANNSFTGTIPESICNASYQLEILDLSDNKLGGTLPSCLFNSFNSLGVLNLGKNQIRGAYLWMLLHNKRCREAYQQLDEVLIRLFGPRQRGRKSPGLGRRAHRN